MQITISKRMSIVAAIATILILSLPAQSRAADAVTVFAAASVTNAITDIGKMFGAKDNGKIVPSFASSSTLAKQIENGAPANVFISADQDWMNYLAGKNLIVPQSRFDLLGNRLVLIAPVDSSIKVEPKKGFPLAKLLGEGRLSVGDPDHVPAGKYAKTSLEKLGVWSTVQDKLARANDVRGALALVERGECPLGIVYSTDAAISKKVKVVATLPEDSHPPVTYPAALVAGKDTLMAKSFLQFLKTPQAKAVFEKYGFTVR